jgi:hypothetical protein
VPQTRSASARAGAKVPRATPLRKVHREARTTPRAVVRSAVVNESAAPPHLLWLIPVAIVVGCDAIARWSDAYASTADGWRARWRLRRVQTTDADAPYRRAQYGEWEKVIEAGIPRLASCALLTVVALTLLWTIAVFLSFGDLLGVMRGHRTLGRTLAVIVLCVVRGGLGWAVLGAGFHRNVRAMVSTSLGAIGLDAALSQVPIPCSDIRADDVRMGYWGAAIHTLALVAFAWSARPRGGTTDVDPSTRSPLN